MDLTFTQHARQRAVERTGLTLPRITTLIVEAILLDLAYQPSPRVAKVGGEHWVAVDGPKGKATAIVQVENKDAATVITIRESETCTQGERGNSGSGWRPFESLLKGFKLNG